jgi:hypothetical protein
MRAWLTLGILLMGCWLAVLTVGCLTIRLEVPPIKIDPVPVVLSWGGLTPDQQLVAPDGGR